MGEGNQIVNTGQWRKQVEKSGGAIINGHVIGGCVTQYLKAKKLGGMAPLAPQCLRPCL